MTARMQTALRNLADRAEKESTELQIIARGEQNPVDRQAWDNRIAEWQTLLGAARAALQDYARPSNIGGGLLAGPR